MSKQHQVVSYRLAHKKTGKFLYLYSSSNAGGYACNERSYTFTENVGADEIFSVDSEEKAWFAKLVSTPWFNSTKETPEHDTHIDLEEYQVVKVETVETLTPISNHRLEKAQPMYNFLRNPYSGHVRDWRGGGTKDSKILSITDDHPPLYVGDVLAFDSHKPFFEVVKVELDKDGPDKFYLQPLNRGEGSAET